MPLHDTVSTACCPSFSVYIFPFFFFFNLSVWISILLMPVVFLLLSSYCTLPHEIAPLLLGRYEVLMTITCSHNWSSWSSCVAAAYNECKKKISSCSSQTRNRLEEKKKVQTYPVSSPQTTSKRFRNQSGTRSHSLSLSRTPLLLITYWFCPTDVSLSFWRDSMPRR